jgi:hypothetical protein
VGQRPHQSMVLKNALTTSNQMILLVKERVQALNGMMLSLVLFDNRFCD